jgi:cyclopropane-fatty-acyl-phospholipid synthase
MSIIPQSKQKKSSKASLLSRLAKSILLKKLASIEIGSLTIHVEGEIHNFGHSNVENEPDAVIYIQDMRVFSCLLLQGDPAAGTAYIDGWWQTDNLLDVLTLFTLNQDTLFKFKDGFSMLAKYLNYLFSLVQKNTHSGSKKNILAHYDIGNDLYELFLDSKMMYSSAYYRHAEDDLETAAEYKLKHICEKLQLNNNDHVIEIGTGWGGFAIYAVQNYGCRVTTTTISDAQYEYAKQRIEECQLEDRITLVQKDYRTLEGEYDKLVSIEMIEAVGHQYLDEYFKTCNKLLKPDGIMLVQAITISDYLYADYIYTVDFIRKYIFPGGCLTSMSAMLSSCARYTTLTPYHSESFACSYARTLDDWHQRFIQQRQEIYRLGYNDEFIRLWEYYLKYCQAGFETRVIDIQQLVLKKPQNRITHQR